MSNLFYDERIKIERILCPDNPAKGEFYISTKKGIFC